MKQRLDMLLVERNLAPTRSQAQALIMAGQVSADGKMLDKPGLSVDTGIELHLKRQAPYVSRAGEKLSSVSKLLGLNFDGLDVLDVGSSTGGFTDFALQNGASHVSCVDVGTAQLAQKLRMDPRVTVMERTDIRAAKLEQPADIAVIDVSFISLTKILLAVAALIKPDAPIVAMVKPQFEAGKALADRYRGIIPVGAERDQVIHDVRTWLELNGFTVEAEADSGVAGAEGNLERFMRCRYNQSN